MADDKQARSEDVGREIDATEPDEATKRAVAKDLEDHLPANMIPGQATQEPQKVSQRESQDDQGSGAY